MENGHEKYPSHGEKSTTSTNSAVKIVPLIHHVTVALVGKYPGVNSGVSRGLGG